MQVLELPFREVLLGDLEFISINCTEMYIDGDKKAVVVKNPNDILLEEIEARGWKQFVKEKPDAQVD